MGSTVNLAARLAGQARKHGGPHGVLCCDVTRGLCRGRDASLAFAEPVAVSAKGVNRELLVHAVSPAEQRTPVPVHKAPPERQLLMQRVAILGREKELQKVYKHRG